MLRQPFDGWLTFAETSCTPQRWWAGRQAKPVESEPRTKWDAADLLRATVSDFATFVISVMRNDQLTKEIATQRLAFTRSITSSENKIVLCELSVDPEHCHAPWLWAGLGHPQNQRLPNTRSHRCRGTSSSSLKVPHDRLRLVSFANVSTSFHRRGRTIQSGRRGRSRNGTATPRE